MPSFLAVIPQDEKYVYPLKTSKSLRRRVQFVGEALGLSFNATLHILINEALAMRGVPMDDGTSKNS